MCTPSIYVYCIYSSGPFASCVGRGPRKDLCYKVSRVFHQYFYYFASSVHRYWHYSCAVWNNLLLLTCQLASKWPLKSYYNGNAVKKKYIYEIYSIGSLYVGDTFLKACVWEIIWLLTISWPADELIVGDNWCLRCPACWIMQRLFIRVKCECLPYSSCWMGCVNFASNSGARKRNICLITRAGYKNWLEQKWKWQKSLILQWKVM